MRAFRMFENFSLQDAAGGIAAASVVGGVVLWLVRALVRLHRKVASIWLFLMGDTECESLIDRVIKEEFRSRFMMMHAKDGIFECDAEGYCTYVNPTLARMFGLEASQMLGNGWLASVTPEERMRVWGEWAKAIKEGVPYEHTYTLNDGTQVKTIAHICHGADRKRPLYYIGVTWPANQRLGDTRNGGMV